MPRWAACPGSIRKSKGLPNTAGVAAMEGTAAHDVVGFALQRSINDKVKVAVVLEDFFLAVSKYAMYVEHLKGDNPIHIEHAFDMSEICEGLYGTADCVIYEANKRILHVIDYKNGKGLPVEATNNYQLQYYALGALTTLKYPCEYVKMTIVQPRCYHPVGSIRSWVVPSMHFIGFQADLVKAAKATKKKNSKLVAGSHCMFCPAKKICKEKETAVIHTKGMKFYKDPKDDFQSVGSASQGNNAEDIWR